MKKQLRTLALLLTATLPTLNASAYDLEIDGIFYNILSLDDMTCEVTSDDVNFSKYEGDIVIPGTVIYNGRTLTVVRIGTEAFWQDHITSVTIPNTVTDVYVEAFKKCDIILTPTAPTGAFALGDKSMKDNPINMWLNDVFTVSVNLAGLPAISLPAGVSGQGLPLGLQLIGRAFDEETVLKTAYALEKDVHFVRK